MSLGSAFNVSRVAVPRRGSCFLRKRACPGKSYVSRVGVPSRGFCFLRITCPEKSYVSRVAVPSRGSCLPRKTCPAKNFISWVGYIGIGSFPFLCPLILKGRSWDPRQKSSPQIFGAAEQQLRVLGVSGRGESIERMAQLEK